jgi:hypothetical protein
MAKNIRAVSKEMLSWSQRIRVEISKTSGAVLIEDESERQQNEYHNLTTNSLNLEVKVFVHFFENMVPV